MVSDPCWRAEGLAAIDSYNEELLEIVEELRQQPFFKLYSVDLLKGCNYFPQAPDECASGSCELYPVENDEVPPQISARDGAEYEFELDGWTRWDMPSDDYYDIYENREQFTGYDGSKIWRFIHDKICFPNSAFSNKLGSKEGVLWQRDFNRAVSGLHSSISAHIVQGILDAPRSKPVVGPDGKTPLDPIAEYDRRLKETPQALDHLYFGYMIILCAVRKAAPLLEATELCHGGACDPAGVQDLIKELVNSPLVNDEGVALAEVNLCKHAKASNGLIWQARVRTRDLLGIMDCVQCNVCRLHGKVGQRRA